MKDQREITKYFCLNFQTLFFKSTALIFFAACKFAICVIFFQIALKWKMFAVKWSQLNRNFNNLTIVDVKAAKSEVRVFMWFIVFVLSYHISYLGFLLKAFNLIPNCNRESTEVISNESIFYNLFSEYTNVIPYNLFIGIYSFYVDYTLSIGGVLNESLIIILSLLLARRFEILNEKLSMNVNVSSQNIVKCALTSNSDGC